MNSVSDLQLILSELANDIKTVILEHINRFGLSDAAFADKLEVQSDQKGLISIIAPDYVKFVISGRKPNSKFPPIETIAEWCESKGIPSDNSTVYLISRAIAVNGIAPRDFISDAAQDIDKCLDDFFIEWAEYIEEAIKNGLS